jgi:DMSO/TMAO reductase YedYZ heme-binding membrane subunit
MAVIRPITPDTIHTNLGGVIRALLRPVPERLVKQMFWLGFTGLIFGLETWTRTQPEAVIAQTSQVLRYTYAHLAVGSLFAALAAKPLKASWAFLLRFRRELTGLGLVFYGLHALWPATVFQARISDPSGDPFGQMGLVLGVIALAGLLPMVTSPNPKNSWNTAWCLTGAFTLFAALHVLMAVSNAPEQRGQLTLAVLALLAARLRWPTAHNPKLETSRPPSKWVGNAIYNRDHTSERNKATRVPADNPTPVDTDLTRLEAFNWEIKVVQRMRFAASSFQPVFEADLNDDLNNEPEPLKNAYQAQPHGTLLEQMLGHFDVLDELERYATDANKLSVLYRRTENERVMRCSLAVNFDPLEDGWTALEVANQILVIVQRSVSQKLKLEKLEVRVYQERFRQGEQRRFERTFNFDLTNLNAPPIRSPDQF